MEADKEQQKQQIPRSLPPAPRLDPWLVFFHGRREQIQTFYSISENRYHVKSIPDMRRKYLSTSSHGWLVLVDGPSDDCFLLNPISMEKIQLPPWDSFTFTDCVLSSPPSDPNCLVLFIERVQQGFLPVMFCQPGDKDWVKQDLELEVDGITVADIVCCGGEIYMLTSLCKRLLIFDRGTRLVLREIVRDAMPESLSPFAWIAGLRMVESCGELFILKIIYFDMLEVRDIEVFKMDFNRKALARVESLGDRAFFISVYCCTSCSAKESGIKGNTIYFILPKDRSLYAFNVEDKTMTITLPCPNIKNHWSAPEWVLPLV